MRDDGRRRALMNRYWVAGESDGPTDEEIQFMYDHGATCILFIHETQGPSWGFFSAAGGHGPAKGLTFHPKYDRIGTRTDPGTVPSTPRAGDTA